MSFRDRQDAGRAFAGRLEDLRSQGPVVLALPRGGVVVGAEVARRLRAALDVVVVRRLEAPGEPELAFGAVAEDWVRVINSTLLEEAQLSREAVDEIIAMESRSVLSQSKRYRSARPAIALQNRTVAMVDDGMTTGSTAAAAARVSRLRGAARVILKIPNSSREAVESIAREVDEVLCVETPPLILALDEWFENFPRWLTTTSSRC
jgi:putative phosphoribosyl transferase